jgi:soluble lytic murein transglycosylase-like protein
MGLGQILVAVIAFLIFVSMGMSKIWQPDEATARKVFNLWRMYAYKYSTFFELPADVVMAQICVESSGDAAAKGTDKAGSVGLMQVTAGAVEDFNRWYRKSYTLTDVADYTRPWINIEVGMGYLRGVQKYYVSSHTLEDALMAYNGGAKNINSTLTKQYLTRVFAYRTLIYKIMTE